MRWSDTGILLATRPFAETDAFAVFLTSAHGLTKGLIKGGQSRRQKPHLQPGNIFAITWKARLEEQLGFFTVEPQETLTAALFSDTAKLQILSAACAVLADALPELQANWRVFENTRLLLENLTLANYVEWERELLAELGFKMELNICNATGSTENLVYISPKTGHAISAAAGEPYKERLLNMPAIWSKTPPQTPSAQDLDDALAVLEFFLETRIYAHIKRPLPYARRVLKKFLSSMEASSSHTPPTI
ncbi:MAG: DNA repair protein RecO [Rickettsiales bacterium]|jgi:DNA repair protein RecO (recombination protein O)|nr:DNA repair protein RecO [Rickettsiales bacterium]